PAPPPHPRRWLPCALGQAERGADLLRVRPRITTSFSRPRSPTARRSTRGRRPSRPAKKSSSAAFAFPSLRVRRLGPSARRRPTRPGSWRPPGHGPHDQRRTVRGRPHHLIFGGVSRRPPP